MAVIEVVAQQVQHFPAAGIRQLHVQRDGDWGKPVDKVEYLDIIGGHHRLQIVLVRFFDDDLAKTQIVLHDQHDLVARLDGCPIIPCIVDHLADDVQLG